MTRSNALRRAAGALRSLGSSASRAAPESLALETVPIYNASRSGPMRLFSSAAPRSSSTGRILSNAFASSSLSPFALSGVRTVSIAALKPSDDFVPRHNSTTAAEVQEMAVATGFASIDALIDATVPAAIRRRDGMGMGKYTEGMTESQFLDYFKAMAGKNKVLKNFIGMGYYGTHLPPVIQRNVLENPGWYTQYTPYQAEIAQGRLESLLNFQTLVTDLTGMPISNASLLDEATAAAEAMTMCSAIARGKKVKFLVSSKCHPQTIAVCDTRADGLACRRSSPTRTSLSLAKTCAACSSSTPPPTAPSTTTARWWRRRTRRASRWWSPPTCWR